MHNLFQGHTYTFRFGEITSSIIVIWQLFNNEPLYTQSSITFLHCLISTLDDNVLLISSPQRPQRVSLQLKYVN